MVIRAATGCGCAANRSARAPEATHRLNIEPNATVAARPRTFAARPRVNEVNQRLMFQQHRIAEGVNHGQINGWHAERDMRRDERVERQMRGDEAMHDGHLASFEQRRLNQELDRNSVHIYDERHPDGQFPRR